MADLPFATFVQNAALLLAVAVVFDVATERLTAERLGSHRIAELLVGGVLAVIGVSILLTPFQFAPGLFFDSRGVLLSVAGLFFGPFPSGVAAAAMAGFRVAAGGSGTASAVAVIAATWLFGLAWRRVRRRDLETISLRELWLFGFAAHMLILAVAATGLLLTVPVATATAALARISLPVLTVAPVATALLGGLLSNRLRARRLADANRRLQAAVEEQLEEVRASRARIVAAGDAERKRVERDIHDGAQQRLVALMLSLRLARSRLGPGSDPSLVANLERASEDAKAAVAELRELARGIHPPVLTEAGLAAAIESLADRSPVPVDLAVEQIEGRRFAASVESTAYFVASEALANVTKYSQATRVSIRAGLDGGGSLLIEIHDDGVGGADPVRGTGLSGLVDRLAAVDGSLDLVSPPGGGTRLVARIPAP